MKKIDDVNSWDVLYLDPMFDKPKKTAKSPKPMQLLQALLTETDDLRALLEAALKHPGKRIVVKLPLKGEPLTNIKATRKYTGQSIRYDVYN